MTGLYSLPIVPIEAVLVMLISTVLFFPAVCVVKMFEEMIKIVTGGYSDKPPRRRLRR
ncbi:MAG TPA: hypothetical protein VE136_00230 [Anaerolineales bacterium]|jgi:hypothetical protein|nr:hypothetical protein [Anaerolineales bacterium]